MSSQRFQCDLTSLALQMRKLKLREVNKPHPTYCGINEGARESQALSPTDPLESQSKSFQDVQMEHSISRYGDESFLRSLVRPSSCRAQALGGGWVSEAQIPG